MTCLEAQSKIIAYIDHHLEKSEKNDFLTHIQCCEDCREELNIYYTMIEGMHQRDSNLPLSRDFTAELNERIERECKQDKKRREFLRSSISIMVVGVLGFVVFGYMNFLNITHEEEQRKRKEQQGEYYFSTMFNEILFNPNKRELMVNINVENDEEKEKTYYEKVREYENLH